MRSRGCCRPTRRSTWRRSRTVVADHLHRIADVDVEDVVPPVVTAEAHPDDLGACRAVGVSCPGSAGGSNPACSRRSGGCRRRKRGAPGPRRSPGRPAGCGYVRPGRSRPSAPRPHAVRTSPRRRGHSSAWAGSRPRARTAAADCPCIRAGLSATASTSATHWVRGSSDPLPPEVAARKTRRAGKRQAGVRFGARPCCSPDPTSPARLPSSRSTPATGPCASGTCSTAGRSGSWRRRGEPARRVPSGLRRPPRPGRPSR